MAGLDLLKEMERLNIISDATHLCDDAFWQALDHFNGSVWGSHNNCRAIVDHNRQYSDDQIQVFIERGAVIGGAFDAWMFVPGWVRGESTPENTNCGLEQVIIISIISASSPATPCMLVLALTWMALLEKNKALMI